VASKPHLKSPSATDLDVEAAALALDHCTLADPEELSTDEAQTSKPLALAGTSALADFRSVERIGLEQVLAEIKSGNDRLGHRVVAAWAKDGQVHRLAKLADELLNHAEAQAPSPATLDLMVQLAFFLGIVRPARANRLTETVQKTAQWQSAHHETTLSEALTWTQAGLLLEPCGMNERVLWNNRLRNPEMDWNWETPEARLALERLQTLLPGAPEPVLDLYRTAVPDCWWDLFERTCLNEDRPSQKIAALTPSPAHASSRWASGLRAAALITLGILLGGALTTWGIALRIVDLSALGGMQTPVRLSEHVANLPPLPPPPPATTPTPTQTAAPVASEAVPQPSWRAQEIAAIQSEFPALERLQRTLATGTLKEAEPILRGGSSIASLRSPSYKALLRWSMVDPPADPEVRRAVIRLFALMPPFKEALPVLEKAAHQGEPYHAEMKEMASILLTANPAPMSADQVERLRRIAQAE
jgi:hypothetical protein